MTIGKDAGGRKTVFVMGINGFVGRHLANELQSSDCRVIGVGNTSNLADTLKDVADSYVECDLSSAEDTAKLDLNEADAIINLAGLANVGASFDNAEEYHRVNRLVHTNLCDNLQKAGSSARVIAVSTGAVYDSNSVMPLTESSAVIKEGSPYALSKLSMEAALKPYQDNGMDIVIVRPFNHTGPGQGPGFLVPDLLLQLRTLTGENRTLLVGNLETKRDYTDVRDIARAYRSLALAPKNSLTTHLYNICSGKSTRGKEILDILLEDLDLTGRVEIKIDPNRVRPTDPADIYGSYALLHEDTGWEPSRQLTQTLSDFVAST